MPVENLSTATKKPPILCTVGKVEAGNENEYHSWLTELSSWKD